MKTVYILGAGPSSAALMEKLKNSPIKIVLVTGEELKRLPYPFAEFQSNSYQADLSAQVRSGVDGTGRIWGGRLVRFEESDFETRHIETGEKLWPLDFLEYSAYFDEADEFFGIGKNNFESGEIAFSNLRSDNRYFPSVEVWSLKRDFISSIISSKRQATIEIWNGVCVRLNNQDKNLISMTYQEDSFSREVDLRKSICVLGLGALENARQTLLLKHSQSDELKSSPLRLDFASHHFLKTPQFFSSKDSTFFDFSINKFGIRSRMRIGLNSKEIGGLNGIFYLAPDTANFTSFRDAFYTSKKSLKTGIKFFYKKIWEQKSRLFFNLFKIFVARNFKLNLWVQLEHHRNSLSNLIIKESTISDEFPIVSITCNTSYLENSLISKSLDNAIEAVKVLGINFHEEDTDKFTKEFLNSPYTINPNTHFSCTTPMSVDSKNGEVDAQGKSHDFGNLWYIGSSVFSTSGHVNPTYSAVVLALRTGDILSEHLQDKSSRA